MWCCGWVSASMCSPLVDSCEHEISNLFFLHGEPTASETFCLLWKSITFLRSYFFSIKQETDWDRIIKYFAILKYRSQSLSIFRNRQISFAIVKYRSESSNMIRNRQSRFWYILREVFCFDSIAYVLSPNPIRIPPIQTSTTCTIALFTIPRIEIFDPDLHRVSGSAWTFSCCRERTRRQRESIHCLAHVRRQYKLRRCCALSHAIEISIPSSFSSGEPTASETFCFLWKTIAHCFFF